MSESFTFQKLARGKTPDNLKIIKVHVPENVKEYVTVDFKLWVLARYKVVLLTNEIKDIIIYSNEKFDIKGKRRDSEMHVYSNHTTPCY